MPRRWLADPRLHLALILLAYAILAAVVACHCMDLLTSDGQSYLRMAGHYACGDLRSAIYDHWAPLAAWLTALPVQAGISPQHAFRLMIALWGAAAVVGAWRLATRLALSPLLRAAATLCAALLAARFTVEHRADLLVAAVLLFYLDAVLDERLAASWQRAFVAGMLGGIGFLAKFFALPFFLAHFTLTVVLRKLGAPATDGAQWPHARTWAMGLFGCSLAVASWAMILSVRHGRFTLGAKAALAYRVLGPSAGGNSRDSRGLYPEHGGHRPSPAGMPPAGARRAAITGLRLPPPQAYSVWQDPDINPTREALRGAAAGRHHWPAAPAATWRSQARHTLLHGGFVVQHLRGVARGGLALATLVLLALGALLATPAVAHRHRVVLGAVLVYCGGYSLVYAGDERYFWFVYVVLLVAAFEWARALPAALARLMSGAGPSQRRLVAAVVAAAVWCAFALPAAHGLREVLGGPPPGRQHRVVAAQLEKWGIDGPMAAVGDHGWWDGLHVAYFLNAKYAGSPAATSPRDIAAEMRRASAVALLVFGRAPLAAALRAAPEWHAVGVVEPRDAPGLTERVAVFRLKPSGS